MEDTIITIGLGIVIALLVIGNIGILIFGTKNIINKKHTVQQIIFYFIPVVVYAIAYLSTSNFEVAAIITLLIMIVFMFLGILISGSRSLLSNF